jgi:hypothetical protein
MGIAIWGSLGTSLKKGLKITGFAVERSTTDSAYNLMPIPPNVDSP